MDDTKHKMIITGKNRILLIKSEEGHRLPFDSEIAVAPGAETFSFAGCTAVAISDIAYRPGAVVETGLRESWSLIPADEFTLAAKGAELLNWNETERFCPRDGHPLEKASDISKRCPECGNEYFPRLNPAIVVLVTKGEKALLVHSRNLRPGIHALVAGFVETGESLEQCVKREIKEETDIEVDDVRYFGSQAWPFPFQLMVGFTASYKSGEIRFADGELTSGAFYDRDNIPELPTLPSLSRKIIDDWISRRPAPEEGE